MNVDEIIQIIEMELMDAKRMEPKFFDTFSLEGEVYYNNANLIIFSRKDYEMLCKELELSDTSLVCFIDMPEFKLEIWVVRYHRTKLVEKLHEAC